MNGKIDPAQLWLGACVGAQLLVVLFCAVKANAYHERPLLLHAAATLMGVLAVQTLSGRQALEPVLAFMLVPALAGLQLLALVTHVGALRTLRRWLLGATAVVVPAGAAASLLHPAFAAVGLLAWTVVVALLLARAWHQSQPWISWLVPGMAALGLAGAAVLSVRGPPDFDDALLVGGLLTLWTACVYLASGWRGRLRGETRARVQARNTVDPLTGLATPLVLTERVHAARHLTRRYGHPSVLMVLHLENLDAIGAEFGPETAESAVLAAASRVREALQRDGDVAARLTHARFGVLAEGAATGQAAATVATRILAAGLKEPLAAAPAVYLRFRIVLGAVPADESVPPKMLLYRLNARLDQEVLGGSERRIVTMTQDELLA